MLGFLKFIGVIFLTLASWIAVFDKVELNLSSQYYEKLPYTVTALCDKTYTTPILRKGWEYRGGGGYKDLTRHECETSKNWFCGKLEKCVSDVENYMEKLGKDPVIYLSGRYPKNCKDYGDKSCEHRSLLIDCVDEGEKGYYDAPIRHDSKESSTRCYPNIDPEEHGGSVNYEHYDNIKTFAFFVFFAFYWFFLSMLGNKIRKKIKDLGID